MNVISKTFSLQTIALTREAKLCKGYRPEARLFPSCVARGRSPRATHEGNESHNHELKARQMAYFYIGEDSSRDAKIH